MMPISFVLRLFKRLEVCGLNTDPHADDSGRMPRRAVAERRGQSCAMEKDPPDLTRNIRAEGLQYIVRKPCKCPLKFIRVPTLVAQASCIAFVQGWVERCLCPINGQVVSWNQQSSSKLWFVRSAWSILIYLDLSWSILIFKFLECQPFLVKLMSQIDQNWRSGWSFFRRSDTFPFLPLGNHPDPDFAQLRDAWLRAKTRVNFSTETSNSSAFVA